MEKPIIAVDIDDVLSQSSQKFVEVSNALWGHQLKPEDYNEDWSKVWGVSVKVARNRSDLLHANGLFGDTDSFSEALPVLRELAKKYRLVVSTSRRTSIEKLTREWLEKHFTGIFDGVFFAGIYDEPHGVRHEDRLARTKNDLLLEIKANYLIDDQLKHCIAAEEHDIEAVLFGDYAWNQIDTLPPHVTRCKTWEDVGRYFAAKE